MKVKISLANESLANPSDEYSGFIVTFPNEVKVFKGGASVVRDFYFAMKEIFSRLPAREIEIDYDFGMGDFFKSDMVRYFTAESLDMQTCPVEEAWKNIELLKEPPAAMAYLGLSYFILLKPSSEHYGQNMPDLIYYCEELE